MSALPKKRGCPARQPQQSSPSKVKIADQEGIQLPARHKKILEGVRRTVSNALDCLDEIENNIARGELWEYAANTSGLKFVSARFRRLHRSISAVALHAKREALR